jgi:hypothetical protein
MRPLFSLHAGEYLVGSYIERTYPGVAVWVPAKDLGVDLLVTDHDARHSLRLQVKWSKDYLATFMGPKFQPTLRACGWWKFDRMKVRTSPADYWILVLQGLHAEPDFMVIRPTELLRRLESIHGTGSTIQSYIWVDKKLACWETRGLGTADRNAIADGEFRHPTRDLSQYLNDWTPIERLVGRTRVRRHVPKRAKPSS